MDRALLRSDANRGYFLILGAMFLVEDNGVRSWKRDVNAM